MTITPSEPQKEEGIGTAHTPGEWFAVAPDPEAAWYRGQSYWSVSYSTGNTSGLLGAQVAQITSLNTGHEEANARLIASAPDLLKALQALRLAREQDKYRSWEKGAPDFNRAEGLADAAILKATGSTQ